LSAKGRKMIEELSFLRYLAAKQALDDRSLNGHVWGALARAIKESGDRPKILEIGAGSGAMIERLLEAGLLTNADYTAVDVWAEGVEAIETRLSRWATAHGWGWERKPESLHLLPLGCNETTNESAAESSDEPSVGLHVRPIEADALAFAADPMQQGRYDLLVAHAVLDLLDLSTALPNLLGMLRPGGFCYFSLNFDGVTSFLPTVDRQLDDQIEALYHRSMDERIIDGRPSGDHRTGRHLIVRLQAMGVDVPAAGSSDWVVHAVKGIYGGDEAYFLRHILHFVESTLRGHPELDPTAFEEWLSQRRRQVEAGELVYVAHQLDLLGQTADGGPQFRSSRLPA
jgi:SAM-dependent methyltransferase